MKSKSATSNQACRQRHVATGPDAALARHRAQCHICRHVQRQEIEEEFLDWVPAREIAETYKLGSHRTVYRHANALDLFRVRHGYVERVLDNILERSGEAKITGASIVAAIRLLVDLETSYEKRLTLDYLRKTAKDNGEMRTPNLEERLEKGRLPARRGATAGARHEDEPDNGKKMTGSAAVIFRELETAHGLEPLPSPQAARRSPASPKSQPSVVPATAVSIERQFTTKSPNPSEFVEKEPLKAPAPPKPSESAAAAARAPVAPKPGTRQEPDGPPQVAGMAWPWAKGSSPFARRGRWRGRPVVG